MSMERLGGAAARPLVPWGKSKTKTKNQKRLISDNATSFTFFTQVGSARSLILFPYQVVSARHKAQSTMQKAQGWQGRSRVETARDRPGSQRGANWEAGEVGGGRLAWEVGRAHLKASGSKNNVSKRKPKGNQKETKIR